MATGITSYSSNTCKLPGCFNPKYREGNGLQHEFCGRTHAKLYQQQYGFTPPPPSYSGASMSSQKKKPKPMKAVHNLIPLPSSLRVGSSSKTSGEPIKFYNRGEPYYQFTNFYPAAVIIDEQCWPSTEHYFQAQKFVGTPYLDIIQGLPSAREAFQLSRNPTVSQWRRSDWDTVKDDVMLKALRCKFSQHTDLMDLLWQTGEREIIEHTTNDSYWADGGRPGKGLNKLGKLLMQVRDDIVAVRGRYKPPSKKSSKSVAVNKGSRLKRSASFSDISTLGHASNDSSFSSEQATPVAPKKPALRRSNSISRLARVSDSSKSSTHPRDYTSSINSTTSIPSKPTGSFYSHPLSTKHLIHNLVPRLLPSTTSSGATKRMVTPPQFQRSYASVASSSSSRSHNRPESRNPITHKQWY